MFTRNRVPVVLQTEVADCALACLVMILCYWNRRIDLAKLRQLFPPAITGTSLRKIRDIADHFGLQTQVYRLEADKITTVPTPFIAHWEQNHFIVVAKVKGPTITIHDPRYGKDVLDIAKFKRKFSGYVVRLTPGQAFSGGDDRIGTWKLPLHGLATFLRPNIARILLLSVGIEILSLATPYYSQIVIDDFIKSPDKHLLVLLTGAFAFLVGLRVLIAILRARLVSTLSAKVVYFVSDRILRHLVSLPFAFFTRRHIGEVISRISVGESIRNPLTTHIVEIAVDSLMVVGTIAVMIWYSAPLALITIGAIAMVTLISALLIRPQLTAVNKLLVHGAEEEGSIIETVRNVQPIKIFGKEHRRVDHWAERTHTRLRDQVQMEMYTAWDDAAGTLLFGLATVVTIYFAVTEVIANSLTVGMLFAFVAYQTQASGFASDLIRGLGRFLRLRSYLERMGETLCEEPEERQPIPCAHPVKFRGAIEINGVGFRYPDQDDWIFRDVFLTVEPGEKLAIVGPTGIGKTTFVRILLGLLEPTEGFCLIDGASPKALPAGVITAVAQDDVLLKGTIIENVAFFDPHPEVQRVEESLYYVGLGPYVETLPLKWHTMVGEYSGLLSAGQRQLLLLARALYVKPKVLILDEGTSNLDLKTEVEVLNALAALNVTQVVVSHRLDSVREKYIIRDLRELQCIGNATLGDGSQVA